MLSFLFAKILRLFPAFYHFGVFRPGLYTRDQAQVRLARVGLNFFGAETVLSATMANAMDAIPTLLLLLASFPMFGLAFMKIVGMMLEHEIDPIPGLFALGTLMGLYGMLAVTHDAVLQWAILLVVAASLAFYPFASRKLMELDHRHINEKAIERYYAAWAEKPDNAAAALALAKSLYDHGYRGAGITLADGVLSQYSSQFDLDTMRSPREFFRNEDFLLKRWKSETQIDTLPSIRCRSCGALNPPTRLDCEKCGRPHILEAVRAGDSKGTFAGKLVIGFVLMAGAIVGAVTGALNLHGIFQPIAIFSGVIVLGIVLGVLFRQPKHDATMYRPIVED